MVKVRPHDYLKSRSVFTVAIENLADATDRSIGIAIPARYEVPMGVEDRLSGCLADVGADVHGIATGLALDPLDLLMEEWTECRQRSRIALREIPGMRLRYDECVSQCHGIEILDGQVEHVLAARSRPTFLGMVDQITKSTIQFYE